LGQPACQPIPGFFRLEPDDYSAQAAHGGNITTAIPGGLEVQLDVGGELKKLCHLETQ
jgi:hypothetical protein